MKDKSKLNCLKKEARYTLESKKFLFIILLALFSCNSSNEVYQAEGVFVNQANVNIGTVEIVQQGDGSNFRIHIDTLKPGSYAMHIHEKGECAYPDFLTSGGDHGMKKDGDFYGDFNPIYVKNELSKYTGKLKKFSQTIFLRNIHLDPDSEFTIMDNNRSSIIIHESVQGGKRIACADLYKKY